ncbi:hypothetical protein PYCC9005_002710 [Savitreella phatthalungensis]
MVNESLEEELLAIDAIYPGCVRRADGLSSTLLINVPGEEEIGSNAPVSRVTSFYLAVNQNFYPETLPIVSHLATELPAVDAEWCKLVLQNHDGPDHILGLVAALHETLETAAAAAVEAEEIAAAEREATQTDMHDISWTVSEPIHDRKSTMLGRAVRVKTAADVERALASIRNDKRLSKATHPCIYAYRLRASVNDTSSVEKAAGTPQQDHDDDGETAAGARLAFLLQVSGAEDVLVVVSRWFGGVLLGDIRFRHITTVARQALVDGGFIAAG